MQGQQSIVKSIIYGSPVQTTYGTFRSLCSAINHKDHIDKIIFYLRNNANFKKYNKFVYAFRLELPTNETFLTEERRAETERYIDGYNDDTGLQGNGEKLLNLLKKFNVRNVLVIVAIRQKDPLRDFHAQHYVQVVKCAKDLLSSLYDKVIQSKQSHLNHSQQIIYQPVPVREFEIPIQTFYPKQKRPENPNYVGQNFLRKVDVKNQNGGKLRSEMEYLNGKIEELANKLEDVIENFVEVEDSQVQFAIRYDKSKSTSKVFQLLAQLFSLPTKQQLIYQIRQQKGPSKTSNFLRSITMHSITSQSIRKMNQQLMSDQQLRPELVAKQNKICGMLMGFVEILLKSYSFARRLALIEAEVEGEQGGEGGQGSQKGQKGKGKSQKGKSQKGRTSMEKI